MIATSRNPLNRALLLDFSEETSVDGLAAGQVTLLAMDRVVVHQLHVFLHSVVHEGDAIASTSVILSETIALILEPFDLVTPDAVHATSSHAVRTTCSEEPKTRINRVVLDVILNRHFVRELMLHWLPVELVIVGHRCGKLLLLLKFKHILRVDIRLEIVETWDQSPGNLQVSQCGSEWLVVLLPELLLVAIPSLATHNVTSDGDKVWLLLTNQ